MPEMKILVNGVLETGRINGIGHESGVLYDHLQIRPWKITFPLGLSVGEGIGKDLEKMAQEFGTTGAIIEFARANPSASAGDADEFDRMIFVGDAHALDANIIARRADRSLGGDGVLQKYVVDGYSSGVAAATAPNANRAETTLTRVVPLASFFGH